MKVLSRVVTACLLFTFVLGDIYLHSPRGSNNRLNEDTATRRNGNRMFSSQNNARGGYNVGDSTSNIANNENQQYRMNYFQSGTSGDSELTVEWTSQHGCGGDEDTSPHKLNCNLVVQFMCQDDSSNAAPDDSYTFRNGQSTETQTYNKPGSNSENKRTVENRRKNNVRRDRGLHESWEWYDNCYRRERNKGLFTADQLLNDNNKGTSSAIFTRESPNENRYGYECPEERDYYPYFHPNPWVDIAVLTSNSSLCNYYEQNSFSHRTYGECVEQFSPSERKHWSTINNPTDCAKQEGAQWVEYHSYLELAPQFTDENTCEGDDALRWNELYYQTCLGSYVCRDMAKPNNYKIMCIFQEHIQEPSPSLYAASFDDSHPPNCASIHSSMLPIKHNCTNFTQCLRQNDEQSKVTYKWGKPYDVKKIVEHKNIEDACFVAPPPLDCKTADWSRVNHLGNGRDLTPLNYTWILPYFPSQTKKRCVLRLRYNTTTDDYDPFNTNANHNQLKENNIIMRRSPIEQNPLVEIGADSQLLQLAINTDQTGRVFQDRSHVFFLSPRPAEIAQDARVLNLNVRGKRGNIVQTYPAVEYDFVPNRMYIQESDLVHIQWTGSNSHDNNAPGGDGATGSAGEGRGGTDRNNMVQILQPGDNYPTPYENSTLYQNMEVIWNSLGQYGDTMEEKQRNNAIQLASSGYFKCEFARQCQRESMERKEKMQNQLNDSPASFPGFVARIKKGIYYYMCSRNNNFTNRSQKGMIVVK